MNEPTIIPTARPAYPPPPPTAPPDGGHWGPDRHFTQPHELPAAPAAPPPPPTPVPPQYGYTYLAPPGVQPVQPTDRMAVFSAVCGLTAIIPIVSQIIGLVLGLVSLRRIRRARRHGVLLPGTGWAVTGLISSGFTLLGWLGFFALMALLAGTFSHSADSLGSLLQPMTP